MKNNIKIIFAFMLGVIISGGIVYATTIDANDIMYKNGTLKSALDDLYNKADSSPETIKFCQYQSEGSFGQKGQVGAKYRCQLGTNDKDGNNNLIYRNFYILTVNTNTVDLIMDRNISSSTMTWYSAIKYFRNNQPGATIKSIWTNVLSIDLPKIQAIVDVVRNDDYIVEGSNYWCFESKQSDNSCNNEGTYAWLYDYTKGCSTYACDNDSNSYADGYWTRDITPGASEAFRINYMGTVNQTSFSNSSAFGVRPVITILKSNLSD